MTTAAVVLMVGSVASVTVLVVWCYFKVLTTPRD
jgi:hypothetical protein